MELPARVRTATDVRLTVEDLESARSATEAVQYAYLANPTGFLLGELPFPKGLSPSADGPASSVQVFVIPAPSATTRQSDAAEPGSAPRTLPSGTTGTVATPGTTPVLPDGSGEAETKLISSKELAGFAQPLVAAPDGPKPQVEFLHGLEVTSEFFASRGLTALAGSLFTEADMGRGEPILVLGSRLGETLFEDGVSVDRQVLSLNRLYRIVGVLAPTGTEVDEQAFTPAPQAADRIEGFAFKAAMDTSLRFTVADPAHLDEARAQLAIHFATTYGEGAVSISIPRAEAQSTTDRYRRLVRIILFLALSALLIAAVNMTNLFYSRAVRRQRSVGILKAVGASVAQVFAVFFLEALIVGGVGAAVVPIFRGVTRADLSGTVISPAGVLIGVASAFGVGGLRGRDPRLGYSEWR